MRKVLLGAFVTLLLPTFLFGQDPTSSEKPEEEQKPIVIITDPELDPNAGPLTSPNVKTIRIGDDEEDIPKPDVTEP